MEESIKNRAILILGILTAIFFIGTVGSCSNTARLRSSRDKEMTARLDSEEKMSKFMQEKLMLEKKLKELTEGWDAEKAGHEATQKALLQEQLVNQSLKEEIAKVTKLKEALEEDLKDALVTEKAK